MRDYQQANPMKTNGKPKYKRYHPYNLSNNTNKTREIKDNYLKNKISEEEYTTFCLQWSL